MRTPRVRLSSAWGLPQHTVPVLKPPAFGVTGGAALVVVVDVVAIGLPLFGV